MSASALRSGLRSGLLALLVLALAGCSTLPETRQFADDDVRVDILDRQAGTGRIRVALENHTGQRLGFLWYAVKGSKTPSPGELADYWDAGGAPIELPIGPGERRILEIRCPGDGFCRYVDNHVGIYVCRARRSGDCEQYQVIWSPTTIAQARGGVAVFDAHLHGGPDPAARLAAARAAGVGSVALSTSWDDQQAYLAVPGHDVLPGLMFPCPGGKVPYSLQACFADGREWPGVAWVEAQVAEGKIRFLGEILTQYYGIAPDDPRMHAYWALAEKHELPVGIHTGSAGPGHGSPDFSEALGNPDLLRPVLERHPSLRLWVMHAGAPYFDETLALLGDFPNVYVDISVINNPAIVPPGAFAAMMKTLLDAGFGNRIMYGSDNADIAATRASLEALGLDEAQMNAILHDNAARFFERRQ